MKYQRFFVISTLALALLGLSACKEATPTCAVEDCKQEIYKNGYCIDHYTPVELKITQSVPDVFCNGDDKQITDKWVYIPSTDIDIGEITWTSSDDSILHITDDGKLQCRKDGTATLTVASEDGGTDSKDIDCYMNRASKISFGDDWRVTLKVGDTYQMTPIVEPLGGYAEIRYKVLLKDYKNYISVSDSGLVTAIAPTNGKSVSVDAKLFKQTGPNTSASQYFIITDDYYNETGILPLKVVSGRYFTDSVGGVELYLNFKNNSDRDIKYIDFQIALYNAVGDEISDEISGDKGYTIRYTGPLTAGSTTGEFTGTRKFYNPSFKGTLMFNYVTITYMDGSTEDIPVSKLNSSDFCPW